MSKDILLGTGIVDWPKEERATERYGFLYLSPSLEALEMDVPLTLEYPQAPVGEYGRLLAKILGTRPSPDVDQRFIYNLRGPLRRRIGETVILGIGRLVLAEGMGLHLIGIRPEQDRDKYWMGYRSVNKIHNQTVELRFRTYP